MSGAKDQTGLVSGPSAYRMVFVRLIVISVFFPWVAALIIVSAFAGHLFTNGSGPIWGTITIVIVGALIVAIAYAQVVRWRESAHGYTTFVNGPPNLEVRDPRTGEVLRAAGESFPRSPMTLADAREWAHSGRTRAAPDPTQRGGEAEDPFRSLGL